MTIEESLKYALGNMAMTRPETAQNVWVIYDSDLPQLVRDLRKGLAGEPEPAPEVISEDYHPGCA
jgi:hypothetical protein